MPTQEGKRTWGSIIFLCQWKLWQGWYWDALCVRWSPGQTRIVGSSSLTQRCYKARLEESMSATATREEWDGSWNTIELKFSSCWQVSYQRVPGKWGKDVPSAQPLEKKKKSTICGRWGGQDLGSEAGQLNHMELLNQSCTIYHHHNMTLL